MTSSSQLSEDQGIEGDQCQQVKWTLIGATQRCNTCLNNSVTTVTPNQPCTTLSDQMRLPPIPLYVPTFPGYLYSPCIATDW